MAKYILIGIDLVSKRIERAAAHNLAPTSIHMARWAAGKKVQIVIRYYPSRKGWAIHDVRGARRIMSLRRDTWTGVKRHERYFPNEDAAIMYALHMNAST